VFPDHGAGLGVERHCAAPERTARVLRIGRRRLFERRNPRIDYAVEDDRRGRINCEGMWIELRFPSERSVLRVDREEVRARSSRLRTDIERIAVDRRTGACNYFRAPGCWCETVVGDHVLAPHRRTCICIQSMQVPAPIRKVHATTYNGGPCRYVTLGRERPFRFEFGDIAGTDGKREAVGRIAPVLSKHGPLEALRYRTRVRRRKAQEREE